MLVPPAGSYGGDDAELQRVLLLSMMEEQRRQEKEAQTKGRKKTQNAFEERCRRGQHSQS